MPHGPLFILRLAFIVLCAALTVALLAADAASARDWRNATGAAIPAPDWHRAVKAGETVTVPRRVCARYGGSMDLGIHRRGGRAYWQYVDRWGPYWLSRSRREGYYSRKSRTFTSTARRVNIAAVWCERTANNPNNR